MIEYLLMSPQEVPSESFLHCHLKHIISKELFFFLCQNFKHQLFENVYLFERNRITEHAALK